MKGLSPLPLFEGVQMVRRGPRSERPIGCPKSIWDTLQKRVQRGGLKRRPGCPTWTAHDILELVRKHKESPIGAPRRRKPEPEPPPQIMIVAVETVVFPKDTSSPMTTRLVQEGRFPGVHWDPDRGGVRTAHVRRLA